jgi:hypothetical protein
MRSGRAAFIRARAMQHNSPKKADYRFAVRPFRSTQHCVKQPRIRPSFLSGEVPIEALFIFVPPISSYGEGWPGSIVSASTMRSSPPSIRAGMRCRTPDAVCAQAGKTNRFRTRRPIYQDGHALARDPGNSRGLRPTPVMDLLTGSELRGDESRAFWNQALLEVAPPRDQQLPRQGNNAHAAHAQARAGEAPAVPLAERALGLESQPKPAISTIIALTRRLPALLMPSSRSLSPLL